VGVKAAAERLRPARGRAVDWIRRHFVIVVMCGLFVGLRIVSVLAVRVSIYVDSATYFDLRFWRPLRLWTVPLVYSSGLSRDHLVTLQVVVGVVAWVSAAVLIARVYRSTIAQTVAVAGVLVLGLTIEVSNFDAVILSESIALSLTVVLVALGLNVVCRPSARVMWAIAVVAFLWAFCRHSNVYLLWLATIAAVLAALLHRRRRQYVVLACVFGAVALTGTVVSSSNTTIHHSNISQIVARRIAPDATLRSWWRQQGMPPLPSGVPSAATRDTHNAPDAVVYTQTRRLHQNEVFHRWFDDHGTSTYLRFVVTHPGYVVATVFREPRVLNGFLGGAVYGVREPVLPSLVEGVVWPETRRGALLVVTTLAIVCFALIALTRRRAQDVTVPPTLKGALRYSSVLLAISVVSIFLVAHSTGAEFERLLLIPAVTARIAAVVALAALIDYASCVNTRHGNQDTMPVPT
jgi:hypothetical protein